MSKYGTSLFIFRREFRLEDNIGLVAALKNSTEVIPCFFLTPEQLDKNPYKSDNCVQFMMGCLEELDKELKAKKSRLLLFHDSPVDALEKIIKEVKFEAIYLNVDYTPFAKKREKQILQFCEKHQIDLMGYEDYLLNPVGSITTSSGVYQKFTPYFNKAKVKKVFKPVQNKYLANLASGTKKVKGEFTGSLTKFYNHNDKLWRQPGRREGLNILQQIKDFKTYNKIRDDLNKNTTYLSAYIKFGCVSIREVYWTFKDKLGASNDLIKQLYWRDFYYNLIDAFPKVIGAPLKDKYAKIKWDNDATHFKKWCEGNTGYPIIDAGMRSMNATGFMHNRSRLITSNFLVKVLLVDWRKGEKYYAQMLYDYDPAVNNGNWQWSAGSGADSQPYFRIFNPWLQSKKFDPNAEYIKKWIPELKDVPAKHIHEWDKYHEEHRGIKYPAPMVDYTSNKDKVLKVYKSAIG